MKSHPIADELLSPKAKHIDRVMIGEEYVKKLNGTKISLGVVYRRIADISADILDQMIQEMKSLILPVLSIQIDESTELGVDKIVLIGFSFHRSYVIVPSYMKMTVNVTYSYVTKDPDLQNWNDEIEYHLIYHSEKCNQTLIITNDDYQDYEKPAYLEEYIHQSISFETVLLVEYNYDTGRGIRIYEKTNENQYLVKECERNVISNFVSSCTDQLVKAFVTCVSAGTSDW
ncbi:hypothetical protein RF11_14288 [Thelohanellus kitauei]|uniref:Uncharacterized protein n=1 Tax=Thelohanellus kitauei TaxID=669202 RepID=A0A0C2N102_THEKT|nr:hypothetical protein RF11_14288 [Thelohanellus kitauei]